MKRRLATFALALPAWLPQPGFAQEMRLAARQSVTLDFPGAIVVFAVDPSTVEASAQAGQVTLRGRRAGDTWVTVVLPTRVETLQVHVDPPAALLASSDAARANDRGMWEGRYDTGLHRFSTTLVANFADGEQTARLRVEALHQGPGGDERKYSALPHASLELESPGRSVVLLDQRIHSSPLTLDGVTVRGAHVREGALEVHAGVASANPLDDLLVPRVADRVASVAWHLAGGPLRVVPSVMWLPDSGTSMPGAVALAVGGGTDKDPLRFRAEVGYGGRPGASFDLDYRGDAGQGWLRGASRPSGYAATHAGQPPGNSLDGAWTQRIAQRTTVGVNGSASQVDILGAHPTGASGSVDLRHETSDRWSMTMAAAAGLYRPAGGSNVTRKTLSVGTAYDGADFGASALVRQQSTSLADHPGTGGRLTVRGNGDGWRANGFVDAQQQAATLDLMLQGDPEIGRALTELGIAAGSPEEAVRLLRDNAALLAAQGVTIGPLRMNPLRVQAGLDVSWRGTGAARPEIGLRLVDDRAQGVVGAQRAFVASLYANWRLSDGFDVGVNYSRWTNRRDGGNADSQSSLQLLARARFDSLAIPRDGNRAISGQVLRNDPAQPQAGEAGAALVPAAGIDVVLDRSRRTRTDADGRFVFESPGSGAHRVDAALPARPGVYFTSPSMLTVPAGGDARFTLNFSGARLSGTVRDDSGQPIPGVTVRIEGPTTATAVTDSSGVYRLGAPPGNARISVVAETLPPGYEIMNLPSRSRTLAHEAPAVVNFAVRAQRSLEGVAVCRSGPPARVAAPDYSKVARPDGSGRFVLRRLPAGSVTLVVSCPGAEVQHIVHVPSEPGIMRGVRLLPDEDRPGAGTSAG